MTLCYQYNKTISFYNQIKNLKKLRTIMKTKLNYLKIFYSTLLKLYNLTNTIRNHFVTTTANKSDIRQVAYFHKCI